MSSILEQTTMLALGGYTFINNTLSQYMNIRQSQCFYRHIRPLCIVCYLIVMECYSICFSLRWATVIAVVHEIRDALPNLPYCTSLPKYHCLMIDLVSFQINSCGENDNQVVQVENSTHIPIGVVFITFG